MYIVLGCRLYYRYTVCKLIKKLMLRVPVSNVRKLVLFVPHSCIWKLFRIGLVWFGLKPKIKLSLVIIL